MDEPALIAYYLVFGLIFVGCVAMFLWMFA
jgi:hypothetical protein